MTLVPVAPVSYSSVHRAAVSLAKSTVLVVVVVVLLEVVGATKPTCGVREKDAGAGVGAECEHAWRHLCLCPASTGVTIRALRAAHKMHAKHARQPSTQSIVESPDGLNCM